MRVATWNVNCWNPGRRWAKRELLRLEHWDVAMLQEVGPDTFEVLTTADDGGEAFGGVHGVALVGGPWGERCHGAAVLVRGPWSITASGTLPLVGTTLPAGPATEARGVWASVTDGITELTVASIHTLNAAGDGPAAKRAHYEAVTSWVGSSQRPLVVGIDTNSWPDRGRAATEEELVEAGEFEVEARFLDVGAPHGLHDAAVVHLTTNRRDLLDRREALGAVGGDGALDVTFQRSSNRYPKANRMDRILYSEPFDVVDVQTLLGDAYTVGSDHALVVADLVDRAAHTERTGRHRR